jgi:ABC-type nitrate/sulfonate/bicarbonate transport system ATPase subunit
MFECHLHGRRFARQVLGELSLSFAPGETLCLLGPSGCGKTTLLNILAGLDRAYTEPVWRDKVPSLGYLFQQPRLLPWRTVLENLLLVNPDETQARALLAEVGLADSADQYPSRLSLGMARRVALVRCLLLTPDLILMDEPLVSLDPLMAVQMRELIRRLVVNDPSRNLLYVTHDMDEAIEIGDRIIVLGGHPAQICHQFEACSTSREMLMQALRG